MRWLAVGFAIIIGLALIIAAVFLLPPPASGNGWRLDEGGGRWGHPLVSDIEPTIVMYGAETSDEVGFGVTVYGSSSCPPELRGVQVGADGVRFEVNRDPVFGGCTADAAPHQFALLIRRDRLPSLPFDVSVRHEDRVVDLEVTSLP